MSDTETSTTSPTRTSWGIREIIVAAVLTLIVSTVLGSLVLTASRVEDSRSASLVTVALLQLTLWVGMASALAIVLRPKVATALEVLRPRFRARDLPLGIALGVASQLLLVPAVSWPWARALGRPTDQPREPACELAAKADDRIGILLLVVTTVLAAPFIEELFFRGFVQTGLVNRLGSMAGVVATAMLFGTIHYQLLQLPALVAFGLVLGTVTALTGRLSTAIITHAAFNATTIANLVVLSSSIDDQCASVLGALR